MFSSFLYSDGAQCSKRGISLGKVVINLYRSALLTSLSYILHFVPGMSKLRHPLRNGTIEFIYLKKIVWGIWGKFQKDINIKESKFGMFKYREIVLRIKTKKSWIAHPSSLLWSNIGFPLSRLAWGRTGK